MSRKLQALHVGNFKAFADTQRIPLKPITLIFGPNSAGKSSFIHSLALAHEAQFGRDKRNLSRLDVHHTDVGGSAIDLGGFRQYVHRGQLNKRVEWGAELKVADLAQGKDQRLAQLLAPVSRIAVNIALGMKLDDQDRPRPGAEPRVDAIEITADGSELLRMSRRQTSSRADTHVDQLRLDRLASDHPVFRQVLEAIIETQTTSEEMRPEDFAAADEAIAGLLPELLITVERLFPSRVESIRSEDADASSLQMLFPISKGNRAEDIAQAVRFMLPRTLNDLIKGLSDALAGELQQLQYLGPLRSLPPRHLSHAGHEDADWFAGGGYAWDVVRRDDGVRDAVNQWLGADRLKTRYRLEVRSLIDTKQLVEPITRAIAPEQDSAPLDYAMLLELIEAQSSGRQQEILRRSGQDSRRIPRLQSLLDEWRPRLEAVSDQRERMGLVAELLARFNDDTFEDRLEKAIEEHEDAQESGREAERIVSVIEQSDVAKLRELVLVDIDKETVVTHRDVGMGISQVLPVLVMAYGSRNKLLAMEQPEIHLHPALQAELADVFIESALGDRQNTFILETHSEHLILRLMRRIRGTYQCKETGVPPVTPVDVSVLYVEPDGTRSIVREMPLNELGELVKSWPGGFFEEGLREQFGDA